MNRYTVVFSLLSGREISINVDARNRETAVYMATRLYLVNYPKDDPVCCVDRVLLIKS